MQRLGFNPGSERSLGGINGHLLQFSCLKNSMDRGTWQFTVRGVAMGQTPLSNGARMHILLELTAQVASESL